MVPLNFPCESQWGLMFLIIGYKELKNRFSEKTS